MANTAGIVNSFKIEIMQALHSLGPGTNSPARTVSVPDVLKGAIFLASGSLSPSTTTAYSTTSEVANSGSYTAGGSAITNATVPTLYTNTGTWNPTASLSWTTFTATAFDTLLVYNSSQSNRAISLHNFGSQTIVSGTFTINFPAAGAATSLIQLT